MLTGNQGVDAAPGASWYAGQTGTGKTWLAVEHALEVQGGTGWPLLILDPARDRELSKIDNVQRVTSARDAIRGVWGDGANVIWTPDEMADADYVFKAALKGRQVVLLVDEAHLWTSGGRRESALVRLLRMHRHAEVRCLLTAQHLSADIPAAALSCAPELYCFQMSGPQVLKRLRELGGDTETIANLPARHYVVISHKVRAA